MGQDHALDGSANSVAAAVAATEGGLASKVAMFTAGAVPIAGSNYSVLYRPEDMAQDILPAGGGIAQVRGRALRDGIWFVEASLLLSKGPSNRVDATEAE
jgi:hypothetical protein